MKLISSDIIQIAAEDDDKKDYSNAVQQTFFIRNRFDEIGSYYLFVYLI